MSDKCKKCGLPMVSATSTSAAGKVHLHCTGGVECQAEQLARAGRREKRLREHCIRLSHAIDQIDCLLLPPEVVKKHTQDVGGPVSDYSVDYNEKAVVERVRKALAVTEAEAKRLQEIVDRLPKTADGVPVAPGGVVWYADSYFEVGVPSPSGKGYAVQSNLVATPPHVGAFSRDVAECYSTREAAEAASEGTKK